jgi:hypothetical protein
VKSIQGAIQRHILLYGTPPVSIDDLDIAVNNDDFSFLLNDGNKLAIVVDIGDYWSKKSVHLSLRPSKDYRLACESFDAYEQGIKLCKEFNGKEETCPSEVWHGNGHFSCFYL